MYHIPRTHNHQSGFSLVELAIALTVIGLLLAGVIKGRELVENTRVSRMITDFKHYEAAITSFNDVYGSLPGDILGPDARVPGCNDAPCSTSGNRDGVIGHIYRSSYATTTAKEYVQAGTSENRRVWIQLSRAGLISSINNSFSDGSGLPVNTPGQDFPETPWRGVIYDVMFWYDDAYSGQIQNEVIPGHYIRTKSVPITSRGAPLLSTRIAMHLDQKIDDGKPLTGNVLGMTVGTTACVVSASVNRYQLPEGSAMVTTPASCEIVYRTNF